ncbi:MAG TPA: hypothetical protein VFA56_15105 [Gaiellaceae bacterium]|nr:hypothetical protein [Gaiellaceae bacterium]
MDAAIDIVDGTVVVSTFGTADTAAFGRLLDDVLDHPSFEPGMPLLFDHSELAVGGLTPYDVRGIAESLLAREKQLGAGRKAMVAPSDAAYGLARMFAVYAETERLRLQAFRDRASAATWLAAASERE